MNPITPIVGQNGTVDLNVTLVIALIGILVLVAGFLALRYLKGFDDKFRSIDEGFKDVRIFFTKWDDRWERFVRLEAEHHAQMEKGGRNHHEVD